MTAVGVAIDGGSKEKQEEEELGGCCGIGGPISSLFHLPGGSKEREKIPR